MNTEKHRPRILKSAFIRVVPWLTAFVLVGCEKKDTESYPQNRLTVEYSMDRETIMIGDHAELVVTAYYPSNGILDLPEIGMEKDVIVLERAWDNASRDDGLAQTEIRYSLTSFRLGDHPVSSNAITCRVDGQLFTTNFPPVVLHVQTSLPADASSDIADIKPSRKLAGRIPRWLWIVLGASAVAFFAGLISTKIWKHREQIIPAAPPVPPHVIALNALQALKNRNLLERDECKPFYTELSLILRTYLEGRFQLNAPDETTEEIVEEMSRSPELDGSQRNILQEFMRQADMVKFAKGHPDRTTMEAAFDTTRQFVEETKQEETNQEPLNT